MHHEDQSLQKQKIHAEDVAYAAFLDAVLDVGEELEKYDECVVLSGAKVQIALDEIDVLKYSVDTAYKVLLDAALSPLSSRLRRCKSNLETRIEELQNLLRSNVSSASNDQREQCLTLEPDCENGNNSRVIVDTTECDDGDLIRIHEAGVQSPALFLSAIILLAVVIDCKQSCPLNLDLTNDMTVTPDEDRQVEQCKVHGATTEHTLNTDLNMIRHDTTNCPAEADDRVCKRRSASGLKHRWRWKLV